MNRARTLLTILALASACAPASIRRPAGNVRADGNTVRIVVLGTTDVHGRLAPWDYYAGQTADRGLARVATLVDSIRVAESHTVLLDSGDLLQGNPLDYFYGRVAPAEPHPVIRAMNRLGYDASALGNHEFNYGLEALDRALAGAAFPFLAGNIYVAGTDSLVWPAYTVVDRGGVRVGIMSFTTPGVMIWDHNNVDGRIEVRDIVASARRWWPEFEAASDIQIVAMHSGMGPGWSSYDEVATGVPPENVGHALAEALPGIELVLLGHTHQDVPQEYVGDVLFAQAKNWAEGLAVATIDVERVGGAWRVTSKRSTTLPASGVPPDPGFMQELGPYHDAVVDFVADTIGWTPDTWSSAGARLGDTPIIDLIQRVQLEATGADLSAASAFTTTARLGPGPITVADVAGLYVYDNTLKTIRITGRQLRDYLEYSAKYFHQVDTDGALVDAVDDDLEVDSIPSYNYDMVAGVAYTLDISRPVGERVTELRYRDLPVTDEQTFTMAINNYRQGGGGGFSMLADAPVVRDRQEEVRQLLIDWVAMRDTIRQADVFEPSWSMQPAAAIERHGPVSWLAPLPGPTSADSDTVRLAIAATNDFHGALQSRTPSFAGGDTVGGAAIMAGYLRDVEERYPGTVLHLDGGDIMQGTVISNLTDGRSTVDVMNAIGLDAATIGNHEFDWTVATLQERVEQAEFPWLIANMFEHDTGQRPAWVEPYAILDRAGLRIAVIGGSTVDTPTTTMPANVAQYEFRDLADVANELAPRLKAEGADVVVLVVHAGAIPDATGVFAGEVIHVAERLNGAVDAIVSGHTHTRVVTTVNDVPIIQARARGTAIGVMTLDFVRSVGDVVGHEMIVETTLAKGRTPDPEIAALVERYREETAEIADRPIAELARPLTRARSEQSDIGSMIADGQAWKTGTPIAIVNGGGVRADLPAGPVTFADVFAVQPFQNLLVRLVLNGEQLRRTLEAVVDDNVGQVSGLRFRYDPAAEPGSRVVDAWLEATGEPIVEHGRAVDPDARYDVTVNNFIASGGSNYTVLAEALEATNTGLIDSDVLAEYLAQLRQPIEYTPPARIEQVVPQSAGENR